MAAFLGSILAVAPIAALAQSPQASGPAWVSAPAAGGLARVWISNDAAAETDLAAYAAEVSRIWPVLKSIFREPLPDTPDGSGFNPDAAVDLYLVRPGEVAPRDERCRTTPPDPRCALGGLAAATYPAEPDDGHSSSAYVVANRGALDERFTINVAHELFHAGQYAFDRMEGVWLMEATASWGGARVAQSLDVDRSAFYRFFLPDFFGSLGQTLPRPSDPWGRRSFPWFTHAAITAGDGIVKKIWQQAAGSGVQDAEAVDAVFPFREHFDEFAVRNWNQEPVPQELRYQVADEQFPSDPKAKAAPTVTLTGDMRQPLGVTVPALAAAYLVYDVEPDVRKVTVRNAWSGDPDAHVWGITRLGDTWQEPEDWSEESEKVFCRDVPDEDLTRLVLIVSRSHMTSPLPPDPGSEVEAETDGCIGWKGTMTATQEWDVPEIGSRGQGTTVFSGLFEERDDLQAFCEVGPRACRAFFPKGTIRWTWEAHMKDNCDVSTSGSLPAYQDVVLPEDQVLILQTAGEDAYSYGANGIWRMDPLDCGNGITGAHQPADFASLPLEVDLQYGDGTPAQPNPEKLCYLGTWQIKRTDTRITGSCYQWNYPYHSLRMDWDLTRVGEIEEE